MRGRSLLFLIVCFGVTLACTGGIAGAAPTDSASVLVTGHVPLWIYDVTVVDVISHAVEIAWKTNGASTSQVAYDTDSHSEYEDYCFQTSGNPFPSVYEHTVLIDGLTPDETYFFRVRSEMESNEAAVSDEYHFTTDPCNNGHYGWHWRWCDGGWRWGWCWGWCWGGGH